MNSILQFAPLILIFVVLYFLMIRPQRKKEKQVNAMRNALQAGDKVTTIGGIKGQVVKTKDDVLTIQVGADKVKIDIMRWAISRVDEAKSGTSVKKEAADKVEEKSEKSEEKPAARKPGKLTAKAAKTTDTSKE
ncbi:MAG: preprotein translocase subunit YajC [Clostridiales Family XIII bacterium]|nr:preprotein translocase subunit YajC [Clostridiales Family XIII bacterium]